MCAVASAIATGIGSVIVRVQLHSGVALGPRERKERFRDQWLDPYVVLQCVSCEDEVDAMPRGKTSQIGVKSSHRKSTVNPDWNETLLHSANMDQRLVALQVWDFARFGEHRFLGQGLVDISTMELGQVHQITLDLEPVGGKLRVAIECIHHVASPSPSPSKSPFEVE